MTLGRVRGAASLQHTGEDANDALKGGSATCGVSIGDRSSGGRRKHLVRMVKDELQESSRSEEYQLQDSSNIGRRQANSSTAKDLTQASRDP